MRKTTPAATLKVLFTRFVTNIVSHYQCLIARASRVGYAFCEASHDHNQLSGIRGRLSVHEPVLTIRVYAVTSSARHRNTHRSAEHAMEFKQLPSMMVKGKEHPIEVFMPTGSLIHKVQTGLELVSFLQ